MQAGPEEARVLDEERLIEAEFVHQGDALRLGVVLPKHAGDGVADIGEHREGDEADDEQDGDSLEDAGEDVRKHATAVLRQVGAGKKERARPRGGWRRIWSVFTVRGKPSQACHCEALAPKQSPPDEPRNARQAGDCFGASASQ